MQNEVAPPLFGGCPKCKSREIQRSHRKNPFEYVIGVAVLPWRCNVCYARFFRPRWAKAVRRRIDVMRQFPMDRRATAKRKPTRAAISFGVDEKVSPGIIERYPVLGLFIPARRKMRHMEHAVALSAKQFRPRPVQ